MTTKEQKRASFALQVLENKNIQGLSEEESKHFVNFCAGVPNMILQNGFGQTLAFLAAKGKLKENDKHTIILDAVLNWLKKEGILNSCDVKKNCLIEISKMDIKIYLQAQRETLAFLEWVKRYAKAFINRGRE